LWSDPELHGTDGGYGHMRIPYTAMLPQLQIAPDGGVSVCGRRGGDLERGGGEHGVDG
jgi:hypothetical protein